MQTQRVDWTQMNNNIFWSTIFGKKKGRKKEEEANTAL